MLVLQDSEEHVALHEGLYGVCRLLFIFTFWWGIQGRTGVKYNSSTDDRGILKKYLTENSNPNADIYTCTQLHPKIHLQTQT